MADPHDDDAAFSEHLLRILHVENLADLYPTNNNDHTTQNPQLQPSFGHASLSTNNVIVGQPSNPVLWSSASGGSEAGPSNNHGESSVRPIPPVPSAPISCSYSHLLREITHTNGIDTTRLEIHGRVGFISHAILQTSVQQYQMFDFGKKSFDDVKQFLKQYCEARLKAGYVMLVDPLAEFYETLTCIGLGKDHASSDGLDEFLGLTIASSASENERIRPRSDNPKPSGRGKGKNPSPRVSLSEQRKRTRTMTVLDVAAFFHLPIEDAAWILKTCPTVLKKICRRHGVYRWPHRKVKSLDGRISRLDRTYSGSTSVEERLRVRAEIEKERELINEICFGVPRAPYRARKKKKMMMMKKKSILIKRQK